MSEQTQTEQPKKDPKYNITLTPDMERDLSYVAGRLDVPKAQVFRDAVSFYADAVRSGTAGSTKTGG